jgi:hypothetical protein
MQLQDIKKLIMIQLPVKLLYTLLSRASITTLSMFGTLLPNLSDLSSQLPGFQVFRALINLLV